MAESTPMPMCPMAETCKGMMEKPGSGAMFMLPGMILIVLGVVVTIEPRILVWIVAISLILMGTAMLMMGRFMGGMGRRIHGGN